MIAIRLAFRVVRRAFGRSVLFLLVGAVASVALSSIAMAGTVKGREHARRVQLVEAGERIPRVSMEHSYRGSSVLIVLLDADRASELSPGVSSRLAPGEMLLSPALADRTSRDETLRSWFPYRLRATISRHGVGSAGELKAYVGADRLAVDSTSPTPDLGTGEFSGFEYYQFAGFVLFVGLPALGLVLTAARFGRIERVERLRVLRLIGMSRSRARLLLATEMAAPAAVGAAMSQVGLYWATSRDRAVLPIVDRPVFGADARLPVAWGVALVIVVVGIASVAGTAVGFSSGIASVTRIGRIARRGAVPITGVLYLVGVAVAGWAWALAEPRDSRRIVAIILIGLGLPAAVAFTAAATARLLGATREPLTVFVAARRVAFDPRVATRLAGISAVMVFVIGVAQPVSGALSQPNASWSDRADGETTMVARIEGFGAPFDVNGPPPASVMTYVPAVAIRPQHSSPDSESKSMAIVASCAQVEALVAVRSECTGERQRLVSRGGGPPVKVGARYRLRSADSASEVIVTAPRSTLTYDFRGIPVDEQLLLPPDDPALNQITGGPDVIGAHLVVPVDPDTWDETQAWVVRTSPLHRAESPFDQFSSLDDTPRWFLLGTLVTALFLTGAVLMIGVDDRTRSMSLTALHALGIGNRRALAIQIVESLIGALAATVLAVAAALVVTFAFLTVNSETPDSYVPLVIVASCGVAVLLLVGALLHVLTRASSRAPR